MRGLPCCKMARKAATVLDAGSAYSRAAPGASGASRAAGDPSGAHLAASVQGKTF